MESLSINDFNQLAQREFSFQEPRRQTFGLPFPMMSYITHENINPIVYSKLISTCKHFFAKRPLLIVESFSNSVVEPNEYTLTLNNESFLWFMKDNMKLKLWITEELLISYDPSSSIAAPFLKKIYRFDGVHLALD